MTETVLPDFHVILKLATLPLAGRGAWALPEVSRVAGSTWSASEAAAVASASAAAAAAFSSCTASRLSSLASSAFKEKFSILVSVFVEVCSQYN